MIDFVLRLANSAGPDEVPHYVAFHMGLHCLLKYPLGVSGLQRVNDIKPCLLDLVLDEKC